MARETLTPGPFLGYPQKGRPCEQFALVGSDYCWAHDPARRAEVVAQAERARAAA